MRGAGSSRRYTKGSAQLVVAAAVAYLGSPLWHYGLVLYTESFLAFFSVAAFAVALRADNYAIAGLLIGAGVLMKLPFGPFALPLIADCLFRGRWRKAGECALPVAFAVFLVMYWNQQMFGDWFRNPQEWEPGSLQDGLTGLAFSWQHGLLWVSPSLYLVVLVLPEWFKNHRRDAILMTLAILLYGGLMATWVQWGGGTCYSARLILPVMPFLFAPLALLFDSKVWLTFGLVAVGGHRACNSFDRLWSNCGIRLRFRRGQAPTRTDTVNVFFLQWCGPLCPPISNHELAPIARLSDKPRKTC